MKLKHMLAHLSTSKTNFEEEPYTYVCQGEGPITIKYLIDYFNANKDIKKSRIAYIKENQIHNNKPAAIIENLDEDLSGQVGSFRYD